MGKGNSRAESIGWHIRTMKKFPQETLGTIYTSKKEAYNSLRLWSGAIEMPYELDVADDSMYCSFDDDNSLYVTLTFSDDRTLIVAIEKTIINNGCQIPLQLKTIM